MLVPTVVLSLIMRIIPKDCYKDMYILSVYKKCNRITCTAYCKSEDILITADSGPDSMLVIWDAKTGVPKKTIFDPHPMGT